MTPDSYAFPTVDQPTPSRGSGPRLIPRIGALEAVRRHWITALVPVLVCVAIGLGLAVARHPTYTAEAHMTIGGINLNTPGALGNFATGSEALAESYSRTVTAAAVINPVAAQLKVSPAFVLDHLSAAPIPSSPVFRIIGQSRSADTSERLANAAAVQVQAYVAQLNQPGAASSRRIFRRYTRVAGAYQRALQDVSDASAVYNQDKSTANSRVLTAAQARAKAVQLRLQALQQNYITSTGSNVSVAGVQELSSAQSASSDRTSRLELYGFVGLVVGALVGVALATLRANALVRRRFLS